MNTYKGIVFFDYDGTLIDETDQIFDVPASTLEALTLLRKNGYATCICSGRSKLFTEDVHKYFNGYICAGGSYVELDGELINSTVIPTPQIEQMRDLCSSRNIIMSMDGETQTYSDGFGDERYMSFRRIFHVRDHWVIPWNAEDSCKINKVIFMYDNEDDGEFLHKQFSDQLDLVNIFPHYIIDATPKGMNKGNGIRQIIQELKIPRESTYAFGDGSNDITMMQEAGTGILMGRHYEGLEPYASFTTGLVKDDGIYHACKELELI